MLQGWANFLIAEVTGSAALTGLIFVGISINLTRILSVSQLPNRALAALFLLLTSLIISLLLLMPDQAQALIGAELVGAGVVISLFILRLDMGVWRVTDLKWRRRVLYNSLLDLLASFPYVIAGIVVLLGSLSGLYIMAIGMIFAFIKALLDAWVLLVEINR